MLGCPTGDFQVDLIYIYNIFKLHISNIVFKKLCK